MFERLDKMVLEASGAELERIQAADLATQLEGVSFYDAHLGSHVHARFGSGHKRR